MPSRLPQLPTAGAQENTPLEFAAVHEQQAAAMRLLKKGADVNAKGEVHA
jgi:ankyrin repeat protein